VDLSLQEEREIIFVWAVPLRERDVWLREGVASRNIFTQRIFEERIKGFSLDVLQVQWSFSEVRMTVSFYHFFQSLLDIQQS
jgi:hypothetical protein